MPRMTPELILSHPSYLSPLKDRELDLRGNKIPAIENLGVVKDSVDSIDLTDNAVRSISNFPRMPRLKHLLLANNPVSTISPALPTLIPNLTSLVLTSSSLDFLSPTLTILGRFPRLEFLSLVSTPMSKRKWYREWALYNCRRVRVLDYTKVKMAERNRAIELFFDSEKLVPTDLATSLLQPDPSSNASASNTFVPGGEPDDVLESGVAAPGQAGRLMTDEERARVRKAIEDAETVEEVRRLQRMLEQGFVPKAKVAAPTPAATKAAPAPAAAVAPEAMDEDKPAEEEEAAPAEAEEPAPAPATKGKKGKAAARGAARGRGARGRGAKAGTTRATRGKKAQEEEQMEVEEEEDDE